MFNRDKNVQGSDTTGDDSSTDADKIKIADKYVYVECDGQYPGAEVYLCNLEGQAIGVAKKLPITEYLKTIQ